LAQQAERAVQVRIAGMVQGVGFRYWVERTSLGLGLRGWVRNRRDGTVEAVFAGPPSAVADMLARCREGPREAAVSEVEIIGEGGYPGSGFEIRPTV
jgi:acylphosphatase